MNQVQDKVLKLPEVMNITALSRSSIYKYINDGFFPTPVKLGQRSVGWFESDIQSWLLSRKDGGNHV